MLLLLEIVYWRGRFLIFSLITRSLISSAPRLLPKTKKKSLCERKGFYNEKSERKIPFAFLYSIHYQVPKSVSGICPSSPVLRVRMSASSNRVTLTSGASKIFFSIIITPFNYASLTTKSCHSENWMQSRPTPSLPLLERMSSL